MALKKETIDLIAKLTKTKAEDLQTAIAAEGEVDFAVSDKLTVLADDEMTTLKANSYKEGKTAGVEIAVKETKQKLNLDFQGKTVEGLVEAASKKAVEDAKIPANEQVIELQKKVTALQTTVTEKETAIANLQTETEKVKLRGELFKDIPAGAALGNDEIVGLMELNGYSFEMKEGKLVTKLKGETVADHLQNPKPVKDIIGGFLKDKKLIADGDGGADPAGRGAGSGKPPVKFTKLSELKAHFESQKKSLLGAEFNEAVEKARAENKDFDLSA